MDERDQKYNEICSKINEQSTHIEKISAFIEILSIFPSNYLSVDYTTFLIADNDHIIFDADLLATGFAKDSGRGKAGVPSFIINDGGKLMLAKYGSYLNYYNLINAREIELSQKAKLKENLEMQKLRGEVDIITNKLVDYDKTESKAKWAIWIAAIAALGTIAQAVLSALKK